MLSELLITVIAIIDLAALISVQTIECLAQVNKFCTVAYLTVVSMLLSILIDQPYEPNSTILASQTNLRKSS